MEFTRTVLVTGGTSGIGYQAALAIARQRPEYLVVVASRNNTDEASASINRTLGQNNTVFLPLDLSTRAKVRSFVPLYKAKNYPPIQALLLNAGLTFPGAPHYSDDNVEMTFAVNHVNQALLFHLLSDDIADDARIVVTASLSHDPAQKTGAPDVIYTTAEDLARPPENIAKMPGSLRYGNSKLANVLWTYALHNRLQGIKGKRNMNVIAFDPGLVPGTGLGRSSGTVFKWLWNNVFPKILPILRIAAGTKNIHTSKDSGENLAWLAVATDVNGVSGVYYEGDKHIKSSVLSYDKSKQEDLWEWTLKHIARDENERQAFELVKK